MSKYIQVFSKTFLRLMRVIAAFMLFPIPAYAQVNVDTLPTFSFAAFNTAFIVGLCVPLLLIVALFKPVLTVKWRYPAFLTLSLLTQLLALSSLIDWQTPVLLISAAVFALTSCLWLQQDLPNNKLKHVLHWVLMIVFSCFIVAVVMTNEVDAFQLWLVYLLSVILIAGFAVWKSSIEKHHLLRVVIICVSLLSYGVALFWWLNVQTSQLWLILFSVICYLLAIVNGCWGVVEAIKTKLSHLNMSLAAELNKEDYSSIQLDPITNLPTYQQSLLSFTRASQKNPTARFVAVVFKPLNFYQVNKVLGHQNSDILLLQLAYNLQKHVENNDVLLNVNNTETPIRISRLQGLDFLVVINAARSNHPVKIIVEDICQQLASAVPQAMSFKSFSLNFELAFGVAIADGAKQDIEQLIAHASDALLEGESSNKVLNYFDQQSAIYTEKQLAKMDKLHQDIINENITWLAKPQVSLANKQLTGFELAVEWQANDGVRLTQVEFDEIAEFSGELYQLTKQMIGQAFTLLSEMHSKNIKQSIAINLSSKDLLEADLADYIEKQSAKTGVPLHYLVIELSEKVLLDSAFKARKMVDQLKALGIKLSIDNFSGSYESLRYLRKAAIHQVKIDCALLNNEQNAKSEKTIVSALVNLIRKMNIPVVATGINNREIEKSYLGIGGDLAQGNLIHQGIMMNEFSTWLEKWQKDTL